MDTINQGLLISAYGIGITFLVLFAVILLIKLILLLFPSRPLPSPDVTEVESGDPNIPHVVAFAAAWWQQRSKTNPSLGKRLENPPGKWWDKS